MDVMDLLILSAYSAESIHTLTSMDAVNVTETGPGHSVASTMDHATAHA